MPDEFDPYDYLRTFDGDPTYYSLNKDQRAGQRFFNSLNDNDQWILRNSPHDPFHSDNREDVRNAVKYLLTFGAE